MAWRSKTSRVHAQIKDFCAILSGLVVAQDYKRGQQLVADKDFDQNADFFQVRLSRYLGCMFGSRINKLAVVKEVEDDGVGAVQIMGARHRNQHPRSFVRS